MRIYRLGVALFGLQSPSFASNAAISESFGAQEPYELHDDIDNLVFSLTLHLAADGDTIRQ